MEGAEVNVGSRQVARAQSVCREIAKRVAGAKLIAVAAATPDDVGAAITGQSIVVAAGAAGVVLLPNAIRMSAKELKVAIDLNAVPPLGIEGIDVMDKAAAKDGIISYGAIGVGDLKMKLHRAAIAKLFERNDQVLDAEEIYALSATL
jgi:hypothetical protein